jgi:hypothetical protein
MVRSIFLITEYGGVYEDSWEHTRNFGFLTYEEAEKQLLKKGWKKQRFLNDYTYENPQSQIREFNDSYEPYFARINEHKFYDREVK